MRAAALLLLLALPPLLGAGCKGPRFVVAELDRLESGLALTPAQRPAWEAFRREAEASAARNAAWRAEWSAASAGERFDARRAHAAADLARQDAGRMIDAWAELDAVLSPAQRAALQRELAPE